MTVSARRGLRRRLALGTSVAILVLVGAFALATVVAVGAHLLGTARDAARQVAAQAAAASRPGAGRSGEDLGLSAAGGAPRPLAALLLDFDAVTDPKVWISVHGHIVARSPNAPRRLPLPGRSGLLVSLEAWRVTGPVHWPKGGAVVVDWPVGPDLDLLKELALVLVVGVGVTAGVALLMGVWATRRVLGPVARMTDAAQAMLDGRGPLALPAVAGDPDEFSRLADVLGRLVASLEQRRLQDRRMLAEAAHQLRTPLAVIQGNLHLLRSLGRHERRERQATLDAMERAGSDMRRLVDDLLVLERAAVPDPPTRKPVDLTDLMRELADDARALAPSLNVVGPDAMATPVLALADGDGLRRALWAVLENALRYTPAGGRVELAAYVRGGRVVAAVEDDGPGIAEAERSRLWERFSRGAAAAGQPGSGLGLTIARALVTRQGGRVDFAPPRWGSTRVELDLAPAAAAARPTP